MATSQYYAWDRSGRPLNPARPIREFVDKLKVAFPAAAAEAQFSWYADESHYQADYPEDHTPYSYTGWPVASPYPYVFATDIMHRPDLGVDCDVLFAYWLSEAKAGRMPWLKYLIYKRKLYHVRLQWAAVANSGHDTHIHVSGRTDHLNTSLGAWSVVPGVSTAEEDMIGLVRLKDDPKVYLYENAMRRRWITSEQELADVRYLSSSGQIPPLANGGQVAVVDRIEAYGELVGEVTLELSDEELERIAEAAERGAEAGAPTEAELVAAAEKGANLAEDA